VAAAQALHTLPHPPQAVLQGIPLVVLQGIPLVVAAVEDDNL